MTTRTKILLGLVVTLFIAGIVYLTYYLTRRQVTQADFPLIPSSTTGTSISINEPSQTPSSTQTDESTAVTAQLSAGFNLFSFGHRPAPSDCKNVFGGKEVFALRQGKWVSCSEGEWSVAPGQGYFVKSKNGENFKIPVTLTPVATDERFSVELATGWNAIGNPYPKSFKLELAKLEIAFDDKIMTLKEAIDGTHVSPLHLFDPLSGSSGSFKPMSDGDTIQLNQGFIIQSPAKATLTFPGPGE